MRALNQEEIEERKKKVLQYVIHEHIRTGKPVGSHSISNTSRLGLSSASIRHTLFELEKSGMIAQPHASAGRIPTDKGYRLYVDSLVEMQRLAVQEQVRIQTEYEARIKEVEDFMSQTSRMLSTLSHYTGFVMTPKWEKNIFSCLELVPITNKRILCAMITESGLAKHFTINTQIEIPKEHLRKIARIINQNFQGSTLENVKLKLVECLENLQEETKEIFSLAREIGEEIKKLDNIQTVIEGNLENTARAKEREAQRATAAAAEARQQAETESAAKAAAEARSIESAQAARNAEAQRQQEASPPHIHLPTTSNVADASNISPPPNLPTDNPQSVTGNHIGFRVNLPGQTKKKPGRNDPCWCGAINPATGQPYKFKKCGLINAPYHRG